MDDLVQFLRARLDEDEQSARAVEDRSAPWDGHWVADGSSALRTRNGHVLAYGREEAPLKPGLVEHWARHDPARALAEVDAKRRILAEVVPGIDDAQEGLAFEYGQSVKKPASGDLLRLLALPYRDHPDYRPDWAPDPA